MKKISYLILSLFLLAQATISAQGTTAKVDFTTSTNCLKIEAKPTTYDSSCTTVTWVLGSSSSTTYSGPYFSYTFSSPGTYQVCMKYKNSCTKWDTTICKSVTVDTCPCSWTPYVVLTKDSADCYKYKYMAYPANTSSSAAGKFTYVINFGDGSIYSTTRDGYHTFSKNGTYKVCAYIKYTLSSGKYCVQTYCKTITVNCAKKCTWNAPSISYTNKCNSYRFTATDQKDSCVYYKWSIDSGIANYTTYGTVAEYKFKTKGYHKIKLTYYNACTGCDTSITKYIYDTCMTVCNWTGSGVNFTKTNCYSYTYEANYIKDTCITYTFIVGNKVISNNRLNNVYFTANGLYSIGYRYYNKCNGCDTMIWTKVEVTCFTKKCTWPTNIGFTTKLATCPYLVMTANNTYDSCLVYKCYVNDSLAPKYGNSGNQFYFRMPKNGTYKICMKIYNPCTGCDTTICSSWTTDCIKTSKCTWPNINWGYNYKCKTYTFEATNTTDSCISYSYKIGTNTGSMVTINGRLATYEFPSNGTYNVCLWLKNGCTNCDTMICKTIVVNCTTTNKCNWNSPGFSYSRSSVDSCMYTFEAKNLNNVCITYKWYIGDSSNTQILTGRLVQYKFGATGVHHVYLILTDTCNKCDTFIHKEITNNCYGVNTTNISNNIVNIFPNPIKNELHIETVQKSNIIIFDPLGRKIGDFKTENEKLELNTSSWSSGIYFIHINSNNQTEKIKILKQ